MTVVLPFMIAFLVGFLLSKNCIKSENSFSILLLRMTLGVGIGIGVLSILTFLSLFIPGANEIVLSSKLANKIILILIASLCLVLLSYEIKDINRENKSFRISFHLIIVTLLFIFGLLIAFDKFWLVSAENSNGGWDAWAIWNLHARFIYYAGNDWKNLFTELLVWSHVDYPMMTPAMIVFGWKILGNDTRLIPLILGGIFTFGTATVLFATLWHLKNYYIAILGTLILIFSNPFIQQGALQYADIPLAYYYICVISLSLVANKKIINDQRLFILIGILLGFCAWTKNEGFIFILSYIIVMGLYDLFSKNFDKKKWFGLCAGLLPVGFVIVLFKSLTIGNDILSSIGSNNILELLTDVNRYKLVINYSYKYISEFNNGNINIFIFLVILMLIAGVVNTKKIIKNLPTMGTIFLTFIFYLLIFLMTPKDITWHMQTSFTRLLIQLYPSLLLVILILLKEPFVIKEKIA